MESTNQIIESWIIEYLSHQCVKQYFEDGCSGVQLKKQDIDVLAFYLNERQDNLSHKEYVCILFLHLLYLEESLATSGNQVECEYIESDDFRKSMPHHIAFASGYCDAESTKKLARNCLIQTYVVICKYCLRNGTDWKEVLNDFHDFVKLMPIADGKKMYDKCAKMSKILPNDDFISEYLDLIRHLVLTLFSKFDDPYLIKIAVAKGTANESIQTDIVQGNEKHIPETKSKGEKDIQKKVDVPADKTIPELEELLRNTRPSRLSDLEEIKLEDNDFLSTIRKKADRFDTQAHLRNVIRLEKRLKRKPPSHQNFRAGPWMLEEETAFIRSTLQLGVGRWRAIKSALKTVRSSQQLKDKWKSLKQWRIDEVKKEEKIALQSRRKTSQP